ncbi:MAG TPA: flippase activity-associated protein Agl23 [Thermoanaerobaculia bacterium]|nr:flippase activity-associated protein Agl23 [Thermoanaerobaculia bacterium]
MPEPFEDRLTSPRWWPFWIAFAAALALRLLWLDVRPLHHDEGVNGWFLYRLLDGYRWEYDPEKFHGPFLYFFGAPFALLLGMTEIALRLPVALASSAMVPLLLPLRRRLGRTGVTAAAWVLAVSPSLVSYGRDLIHETYLVALTLALIAAAVRWLEEGSRRDLILAALALSLLFTVKETAALTIVSLLLGALAVWLAAGRPPLPRAGEGRGEGSSRTWGLLALTLILPYVLLYTSFFTNPPGLVDSFRAYLPWAEKGFEGTGHEKPWPYFFRLLGQFEPLALAGGVLGSAVAFWRRDLFGVFVSVAWMAQLAAYSAIPYKTPWLGMNMVLLLALSTGVLFGEIGRRRFPGAFRAAVTVAGLLAVTWSASRAVEVSFLRYDDESLGLVYVQTHRDLRGLMTLIDEAAVRSPQGKGLAIRFYTGNRWPLPWYLRDYTGVLYTREVPMDPAGDVLICDSGQEQTLRQRLKGKYVRRKYTLRHKVELVVYVRPSLLPPESSVR